jgi:hypothetical protein
MPHQSVTTIVFVTITDIPSSTYVSQPCIRTCNKYMYHIMHQTRTKNYTIPCINHVPKSVPYHTSTMYRDMYHNMHQPCTIIYPKCWYHNINDVPQPSTKECNSYIFRTIQDVSQHVQLSPGHASSMYHTITKDNPQNMKINILLYMQMTWCTVLQNYKPSSSLTTWYKHSSQISLSVIGKRIVN